MTFYSLPISGNNLMSGKSKKITKNYSIRQNLDLMLATKSPEECSGLSGYGTVLKKFHFFMSRDDEVAKQKQFIQKEVKESLEKSIKIYEPRLHQPKVVIKLINYESLNLEQRQKIDSSKFPIGFFLSIEVLGFVVLERGKETFNYEKKIPLG